VGPLPTAQGNYKYAMLAVEYFTKWIEVKPLVNITSASLKKIDCDLFKDFYHQMGIEAAFASVYHPQSKGAVERANTLMFTSVTECLEDQKKGKWAEELLKAVWSHNTSISRATNFTPLKLLFSEEVVT
jgi:hypothetical protein